MSADVNVNQTGSSYNYAMELVICEIKTSKLSVSNVAVHEIWQVSSLLHAQLAKILTFHEI